MKKACAFLLALTLTACVGATPIPSTPTIDALTGRLTFAGSTTMQPLVAELGDAFRAIHPYVTLDIAGGGSAVGIKAIHDGTTDIGMASRSLTPEEAQGIQQYQVAIDVLAIVVNPKNPLTAITIQDLADIYLGKITNWQTLGGPDLPIDPVQRETSSGSRGAFDELVLAKQSAAAPNLFTTVTAGDEAARVASDPGAIGYVGFGNLDVSIKLLAVGGVLPSQETARDGSYPLVRPLLLMTGSLSQPLAQTFIDFVLGPQGQKDVQDLGWVPVK